MLVREKGLQAQSDNQRQKDKNKYAAAMMAYLCQPGDYSLTAPLSNPLKER
jgi:hypothetical protein